MPGQQQSKGSEATSGSPCKHLQTTYLLVANASWYGSYYLSLSAGYYLSLSVGSAGCASLGTSACRRSLSCSNLFVCRRDQLASSNKPCSDPLSHNQPKLSAFSHDSAAAGLQINDRSTPPHASALGWEGG